MFVPKKVVFPKFGSTCRGLKSPETSAHLSIISCVTRLVNGGKVSPMPIAIITPYFGQMASMRTTDTWCSS